MLKNNRGKRRHLVDVLEPPPDVDSRGQREGDYKPIARDVFCGIKPLTGSERDVAHQLLAGATHLVELTGPLPITERCVLRVQPTGERLEVGYADDTYRNGFELKLLCTEIKGDPCELSSG